MKKFLNSKRNLILFVMICAAFAVQNLNGQTKTKSAEKVQTVTVNQTTLNDCSKAFDELEKQDELVISQDAEIKLLNERLESEKEKKSIALELAESRRREAQSEREAKEAKSDVIAAKDETIAAKDKQIENKDKEIEILKKRKISPIEKAKYIGLGFLIGKISGFFF